MCLSVGLLWKSCVACLLTWITRMSVTRHLQKGESIGSENTAALSGCLNMGWMASEAGADQRDICFLASLASIWVSMVLSILTTHTTLCLTNSLLKLSILMTGWFISASDRLSAPTTTIVASFSSRICRTGILSWWILITHCYFWYWYLILIKYC